MSNKSRVQAQMAAAGQRLSVGELGQALQQMASAVQGASAENSFEKWKKRYQTEGLEGLKDLPRNKSSHPQATSPEVKQMIIELSKRHPGWGCVRLSDYLKSEKHVSVSSPTVQNILIKENMGSRHERLLKLQSCFLQGEIDLSEEQITLIEADNPCFRERDLNVSAPGQLLVQDTFYIGNISGIGKCYLHAVVDAFSSYAFGFLHTTRKPEPAVAVLHNEVLPVCAEHDITIQAVMSDSDKEFSGKETHPYRVYLMFNDIKHRQLPAKKLVNGCMERFKKTVHDEFKVKGITVDSFETIQSDMANWIQFYNTKRPHEGYPNMGQTPAEVFFGSAR